MLAIQTPGGHARSSIPVHLLLLLVVSPAFAQQTLAGSGLVKGRTYVNSFLGLSVTPAPPLEWGQKIKIPENENTMVLVQTWGENRLIRGQTSTVVYADRLSYFPEGQRSQEAYLRKVVRSQREQGFEVLHENVEDKIGKEKFVRADFAKTLSRLTVLVTTRKGYALVLIFTGSNDDEANEIIHSTAFELSDEQKR
jgi:hypothetical protein